MAVVGDTPAPNRVRIASPTLTGGAIDVPCAASCRDCGVLVIGIPHTVARTFATHVCGRDWRAEHRCPS